MAFAAGHSPVVVNIKCNLLQCNTAQKNTSKPKMIPIKEEYFHILSNIIYVFVALRCMADPTSLNRDLLNYVKEN